MSTPNLPEITPLEQKAMMDAERTPYCKEC